MEITDHPHFKGLYIFLSFLKNMFKLFAIILQVALVLIVCYCGIQIKVEDSKIQMNGLNPQAEMIKVHASGLGFNDRVFKLEISGGP